MISLDHGLASKVGLKDPKRGKRKERRLGRSLIVGGGVHSIKLHIFTS
jgi:hypothetical protein